MFKTSAKTPAVSSSPGGGSTEKHSPRLLPWTGEVFPGSGIRYSLYPVYLDNLSPSTVLTSCQCTDCLEFTAWTHEEKQLFFSDNSTCFPQHFLDTFSPPHLISPSEGRQLPSDAKTHHVFPIYLFFLRTCLSL